MKRIKLFMFPATLVGVLAVLFIGTTGIYAASSTHAASASSCGSWSVVKSPSVGPTSTFNAVAAVSAKDVWAVGYTSGYDALIEHWNGTSWQVVASNAKKGTELEGITVISANDIWAVGSGPGNANGIGAALHWNGTQWSVVHTPNPAAGSNLHSISAVSSNNVWATGTVFYTSNGAEYNSLVEHWNGTSWKIVPSPSSPDSADVLQSVSVVSAKDIWSVGTVLGGYPNSYPEIEHWNGSQWSLVPPPNSGPTSGLNSVEAISTSNVWAVGTANNQTLVEHYNGSSWSIVSSPNVGTGYNDLNSVTVVSANNIWAVGYYVNSSNIDQTLIEQWNGTSWNIVQSPNVGTGNSLLNGVSAVPTTSQVWAVGVYGPDFTKYKTFTEHYC